MSSKPREVRIIKTKGQHGSDLQRVMVDAQTRNHNEMSIKGLLPKEIPESHVKHLSFDRPLYGASVTLYFETPRRDGALSYLQHLPPLPLTMFKETNGRRVIWCQAAKEHPRTSVMKRTEIVPFLLTIHQGQTFGPYVRIKWVTRIGDTYAVVEIDVEKDPACFYLVDNDPMIPSAVKWRWLPSKGFPVIAHKFGLWGNWVDKADIGDAHCVCFYPISRVMTEGMQNDPVTLFNGIMLDAASRWEGHDVTDSK
jgi:hypothetical protein